MNRTRPVSRTSKRKRPQSTKTRKLSSTTSHLGSLLYCNDEGLINQITDGVKRNDNPFQRKIVIHRPFPLSLGGTLPYVELQYLDISTHARATRRNFNQLSHILPQRDEYAMKILNTIDATPQSRSFDKHSLLYADSPVELPTTQIQRFHDDEESEMDYAQLPVSLVFPSMSHSSNVTNPMLHYLQQYELSQNKSAHKDSMSRNIHQPKHVTDVLESEHNPANILSLLPQFHSLDIAKDAGNTPLSASHTSTLMRPPPSPRPLLSSPGERGWWQAFARPSPNAAINTSQFRIICPSPIGSPYHSSNPTAIDPIKALNYHNNIQLDANTSIYADVLYRQHFPVITPHDQATAALWLLDALGLVQVHPGHERPRITEHLSGLPAILTPQDMQESLDIMRRSLQTSYLVTAPHANTPNGDDDGGSGLTLSRDNANATHNTYTLPPYTRQYTDMNTNNNTHSQPNGDTPQTSHGKGNHDHNHHPLEAIPSQNDGDRIIRRTIAGLQPPTLNPSTARNYRTLLSLEAPFLDRFRPSFPLGIDHVFPQPNEIELSVPSHRILPRLSDTNDHYHAHIPSKSPSQSEDHRTSALETSNTSKSTTSSSTTTTTPHLHHIIGSSMGGFQALAFASLYPNLFDKVIAIATAPKSSQHTIGIRSIQRACIVNDVDWNGGQFRTEHLPRRGLYLSRMIGNLHYRSTNEFNSRFQTNPDHTLRFDVEYYLAHQGKKFVQSYNPLCYITLSKSMDLMDLALLTGDFDSSVQRIGFLRHPVCTDEPNDEKMVSNDEKRMDTAPLGGLLSHHQQQQPHDDHGSSPHHHHRWQQVQLVPPSSIIPSNKKDTQISTPNHTNQHPTHSDSDQQRGPLTTPSQLYLIGVKEDELISPEDLKKMAQNLGGVLPVYYDEVSSIYGHDSFLLDIKLFAPRINSFIHGGVDGLQRYLKEIDF